MATSWFRRLNKDKIKADALFTKSDIYDMIKKRDRNFFGICYITSLISLYRQKIEVRKNKELM